MSNYNPAIFTYSGMRSTKKRMSLFEIIIQSESKKLNSKIKTLSNNDSAFKNIKPFETVKNSAKNNLLTQMFPEFRKKGFNSSMDCSLIDCNRNLTFENIDN